MNAHKQRSSKEHSSASLLKTPMTSVHSRFVRTQEELRAQTYLPYTMKPGTCISSVSHDLVWCKARITDKSVPTKSGLISQETVRSAFSNPSLLMFAQLQTVAKCSALKAWVTESALLEHHFFEVRAEFVHRVRKQFPPCLCLAGIFDDVPCSHLLVPLQTNFCPKEDLNRPSRWLDFLLFPFRTEKCF